MMVQASAQDVKVTLTHLVRDPLHENEKPYELWMKTGAERPKTNCQYEDKQVTVHDVRSVGTEFDVDKNGFKYIRHTSQCLPRFDDLAWETPPIAYLEETVDVVQRQLGAELVLVLNWAVKCSWRFRRVSYINFLSRAVSREQTGKGQCAV